MKTIWRGKKVKSAGKGKERVCAGEVLVGGEGGGGGAALCNKSKKI
jgi:hypothetical protein